MDRILGHISAEYMSFTLMNGFGGNIKRAGMGCRRGYFTC